MEKFLVFTTVYFTANIYASNERVTDMESNCPTPEQKDLKQVQGGYFL